MDDFTGIARDDIGSYTNIKECKLKCNKWCKNIINNEDIKMNSQLIPKSYNYYGHSFQDPK